MPEFKMDKYGSLKIRGDIDGNCINKLLTQAAVTTVTPETPIKTKKVIKKSAGSISIEEVSKLGSNQVIRNK